MEEVTFIEMLQGINELELGEFKEELIQCAKYHAYEAIGDPEEHMDAVVNVMTDYLTGASVMWMLMNEKEKNKPKSLFSKTFGFKE